ADGYHITTLLLAFFFRHLPELIRKGHVYLAQPPLYRIEVGKETHWARDDAHKEEILAALRANAKPEITRFKGLGAMMPRAVARVIRSCCASVHTKKSRGLRVNGFTGNATLLGPPLPLPPACGTIPPTGANGG